MLRQGSLLLLLVTLAGINATKVRQCRVSDVEPPKPENVHITGCDEPPCKLKKKTTPAIDMLITPENDINELITSAHAELIANIPFPFIGVEGTSACKNIYSEDGKTQVGCPLKGGQTYLYKNRFDIMPIYPTVPLTIWWGLVDKDTKKYISCFEVPAKITN